MAKEGLTLVIPSFIIFLVLAFVSVMSNSIIALIFAVVFLISTFFLMFFFRDPERKIVSGNNLILAPADGKVIAIKPNLDINFLNGKGTQVSIFLSVFDPHVNRIPISGVIEYCRYNPGKFFPAFKDKASQENEQNEIGIQNDKGRIIMKQIAGILARRVVCRIKKGDRVKAGDKFGIIKFGSRFDLFLPENVELKIKKNDKVKAGETVIGVFKG